MSLDCTTDPTVSTPPTHLGEGSPAWKAATHTTDALRSGADLRDRFRLTNPGPATPDGAWRLPVHGAFNPGTDPGVTTPGSFALRADIGGPLSFASPDTPGMPAPSDKTAWDFLPEGWGVEIRSDGVGTGVLRPGGARGCSHGWSEAASGLAQPVEASTPDLLPPRRGGGSAETPGGRGEGSSDEGVSGSDPCVASLLRRSVFTDARGVTRRVTTPPGFTPITQLDHARLGIVTPQMRRVAEREPHLTAEQVRDEIAAGRMIIPANINHLAHRLDPMCIGRASRTKVNANMGASPVSSSTDEEVEKLRWAEKWGADTVMDLSTGGDLDATRAAIIAHATVPIGTVPIYSMIIGRTIEALDRGIILETIERQALQGVDYMTIHAGVRKAHIPLVKNRLIGIVSRGGSLLAKWCLVHNAENPMYTLWDEICEILRRHDVSFSIGDGLRPGGLADATDLAQLAELQTIGELTERAWRHGVQVMVEGPGHVPFDQIEFNAKLQRRLCHGAPFYVLGPLVTDVFPGYDHITSCIGATSIAYHGASMLCYVTPKEHLGLPKKGDVKEGCIAYKIAAHAADVALGIPATRDWDDSLTKARAALNWSKHFELAFDEDTARAYHDEDLDVDTDFCAMCGHDWCSVRISKEIQDFASGKADGFERMGAGGKPGAPIKSDALSEEQQAILKQRGYLKPEEIHKLAAKKSSPVPNGGGGRSEARSEGVPPATAKLACHSDFVDPEEAKKVQAEVLVQLNTAPAHNLPSGDRLI